MAVVRFGRIDLDAEGSTGSDEVPASRGGSSYNSGRSRWAVGGQAGQVQEYRTGLAAQGMEARGLPGTGRGERRSLTIRRVFGYRQGVVAFPILDRVFDIGRFDKEPANRR